MIALGIRRKLYLDRSEEMLVGKGHLHSYAVHCLIRGPVASMRGFFKSCGLSINGFPYLRYSSERAALLSGSSDWEFSESSCHVLFLT